jgi:hypothetical protein
MWTFKAKEKERTANRLLAKKRVQWLIELSASYQILCWVDILVLRNPLLRQAPNRQRSFEIRTKKTINLTGETRKAF